MPAAEGSNPVKTNPQQQEAKAANATASKDNVPAKEVPTNQTAAFAYLSRFNAWIPNFINKHLNIKT